MLIALAGGVGGARLAEGLSRAMGGEPLVVAVNVGDDFEHLGLSISPDIDTVCYTLAGLDDHARGWGRTDETWRFMAALSALGGPDWFALGDADLALHVLRTQQLAAGHPLSAVTADLASRLGIGATVLPITDDRVRTTIRTDDSVLSFQDYFVRLQCVPVARGFDYVGADAAQLAAGARSALADSALRGIVLCPSNPWLSIGPMLAMPALADAIRARRVPSVVVSPIVGGRAIKGPAAKLMAELGLDVSALSIARHYHGLVDAIVIDRADAALEPAIADLGIRVLVTDTIMSGPAERARLATELIDWSFP